MLNPLSRSTVLISVLLFTGTAIAQEQLFRTLNVPQGARVRLGIHGNVSDTCTPGALPEIKVVTPPKNGTLAVNSGKTKPGSLAGIVTGTGFYLLLLTFAREPLVQIQPLRRGKCRVKTPILASCDNASLGADGV